MGTGLYRPGVMAAFCIQNHLVDLLAPYIYSVDGDDWVAMKCLICKGGHVALKRASPQVYFCCALCALNFKTQLLIATFRTTFGVEFG